MSGSNRSYIDKAKLRKTLKTKCTRHNEFLSREVQHETFLRVSSQYYYFMSVSGAQARISGNNSFFCRQFFLNLNIMRITGKLK